MHPHNLVRSALALALVGFSFGFAGCGQAPGPGDSPDASSGTDANTDASSGLDASRDSGPCANDRACDDGVFCNGAERCAPTAAAADAHGCAPASAAACLTGTTCDEAHDTCVSDCTAHPDADGDGSDAVSCGGDDCDDQDPHRAPTLTEVCDTAGLDEDCNPATFGMRDADADGFTDALCCNGTACGDDCDDTHASAHPGQVEACDGLDNDCDTSVDEGLSPTSYFPDCDSDGAGDVHATALSACAPPTVMACATGGVWVTSGTDCDDTVASTNPGANETCNGIDDNCNGMADEGIGTLSYLPDCDHDGYGDAAMSPLATCGSPSMATPCSGGTWVTIAGDCNEAVASIHVGATEVCNTTDDDCDGSVDEMLAVSAWRPDCDRDAWGDSAASPISACIAPSSPPTGCPSGGWAATTGDCADTVTTRNPGVTEECNAIDDNCNTLVDDITTGTVVCTLGQTQACTNACGVAGTHSCNVACTAYQACSSASTEVCNYCDDNGNGSLSDEVSLAMTTRTLAYFPTCGPVFGDAVCRPRTPTPPFFFDAVVLQGTANDRAGAVWLNPMDWVSGYGPVTIDATMTVTAHPENGVTMVEEPLGGWALVVATAGTLGVGTPREYGIPSGLSGLAARWHWQRQNATSPNSFNTDDSLSLIRLPSTLLRPSGSFASWNHLVGTSDSIAGANAVDFGGATVAGGQRIRLRYTPDAPATTAINEEMVELIEGDGATGTATVVYRASDGFPEAPGGALRPGSPLRIGFTAGTYVETGQFFVPPGGNYGVPVEAHVQLYRFTYDPISGNRYDLPQATMSETSVCAP